MTLDKNRLASAVKCLLVSANWYDHSKSHEMTMSGEFMYLTYAWQAYYCDDDTQAQSILVPAYAWAEFVATVRELSNERLRYTLLSQVFSSTVHDRLKCPNKLSEQELQDCVESICEILEKYLLRTSVVVVPLYNVQSESVKSDQVCMPLANTRLHFRGSAVLKGDILGGSETEEEIRSLQDCCVLVVTVSGDRESQRAIALRESGEALKVLRFIKRWKVAEVRQPPNFNPARSISLWHESPQLLVYYNPEDEDRRLMPGHYAKDSTTIDTDDIAYASQFCGLEDVNHHFSNAGHPISDQIVRALTLYDNGTVASSRWEALHNYVVSVNVALLSGQRNTVRLRQDLETLIRYGRGYTRSGYLDGRLSRTTKESWDEVINDYAKPFEDFYRIRSILTHGGSIDVGTIADSVVLQAREIAHNSVRLIAKLARQEKWMSIAEAKKWFEAKRK